ncbi:MAG TPA: DUF1343 domain-containing protein [Ignavibacteria bacterium]|nr:DUF1343 domain-containing protein [Ignavibacteria bacterium]
MIINFLLTAALFYSAFIGFDINTNKKSIGYTLSDNKFILGNENLLSKNSDLISGKSVGLIVNSSSVTSSGDFFPDMLSKKSNLTKIFTPEHGLRGNDRNEDYIDEVTGIQIVSLYGAKKKPTANDLYDTDVLVYDIQDVGARFYTFINTMFYCMEAAYENEKGFIVCDRPMIPNAEYVDGFMLQNGEESFVGMLHIPIAYGMTCGELAKFINDEYFAGKCRLSVVTMDNYTRDTKYESLDLPWIKPSPNIYFPSSAVSYLGTCLFEGTNFAEGRGTDKPFEIVGAPYCDGNLLANELNALNLNGVTFESISFTPGTIASNSNPPKFVGEICEGVYIKVTNEKTFEPVKAGLAVMYAANKLFPGFQINKNKFIDKLAGSSQLREMLNNGSSYDQIIESYSSDLQQFRAVRENYLIYK